MFFMGKSWEFRILEYCPPVNNFDREVNYSDAFDDLCGGVFYQ